MGERWRQDDALSVLDSSTGRPADGAVEKIVVLIHLHEVLARVDPRHDLIPASDFFTAPTLTI